MVVVVKNPSARAGDIRDAGSIPGSGRSPRGEHGNPLQYSCLEKPMDSGAWWTTVHVVTKSWTRLKRLSTHAASVFKIFQWLPTSFRVKANIFTMPHNALYNVVNPALLLWLNPFRSSSLLPLHRPHGTLCCPSMCQVLLPQGLCTGSSRLPGVLFLNHISLWPSLTLLFKTILFSHWHPSLISFPTLFSLQCFSIHLLTYYVNNLSCLALPSI